MADPVPSFDKASSGKDIVMTMIIQDQDTQRRVIARRRRLGQDKFDEVWNGVYVMAPMANIEHQEFVSGLDCLLGEVVRSAKLGMVLPGTNVSDRREDWKKNFRCPDVAVFLKDTKAINCDTHWFGGPDFAVEVAVTVHCGIELIDRLTVSF